MDCLDLNQLALYSTTYGLTAKERRAYEQHLDECPPCRERITRMQQNLRELDLENKQVCDELRDSLEAHALGNLHAEQREQLVQHLSECHACHFLLARLSGFPDWHEAGVAIPSHLAERIESALSEKLGLPRRGAASGLREIAERVKDFVDEIRLSLTPLSPAPAFRGEEQILKSDFVEIQHSSGNLVVNAGIAGVIVELYSEREKYLDDGETDAEGRVIFAEMKPGLYKIRVQGHRIEGLK